MFGLFWKYDIEQFYLYFVYGQVWDCFWCWFDFVLECFDFDWCWCIDLIDESYLLFMLFQLGCDIYCQVVVE